MEFLELIEELKMMVDSAKSVPFSNLSLINKKEFLELIKEIKEHLPLEMQQAIKIKKENKRIIEESEKESKRIIEEAKIYGTSIIQDHMIVKKAKEEADRILDSAETNSNEIKRRCYEYVNTILAKTENIIFSATDELKIINEEIRNNKKEIESIDDETT